MRVWLQEAGAPGWAEQSPSLICTSARHGMLPLLLTHQSVMHCKATALPQTPFQLVGAMQRACRPMARSLPSCSPRAARCCARMIGSRGSTSAYRKKQASTKKAATPK